MNRAPFLSLFSVGGWIFALVLLISGPPHFKIADHQPPCEAKLSAQTNASPATLSETAQLLKENSLNTGTSYSAKTASTTPPIESPPLHHPNHLTSPHSSIDWHAERLLAQIEELVQLEGPAKEAVKTAIVNQQRERYSGSIRFDDNLRAALGSQASDLEQQLAEQNSRRREKEKVREVAALSHQLKLSQDQSGQVEVVLDQLQAALAPAQAATEKLLDEGMQKHLDPAVQKSQLRESMAIIEQSQQSLRASRQQFLATELRPILTPEQYQAWLNDASTDE
jgi:hypothetical protein